MSMELRIMAVIICALVAWVVVRFERKIKDVYKYIDLWLVECVKDTRDLRGEVERNEQEFELHKGIVDKAKKQADTAVSYANDAFKKASFATEEARISDNRLNKLEAHARYVKDELDGKTWVVRSLTRNFVRFDKMGEIIGVNSMAGATLMTKVEAEKVLERINSTAWVVENRSSTVLKEIGGK